MRTYEQLLAAAREKAKTHEAAEVEFDEVVVIRSRLTTSVETTVNHAKRTTSQTYAANGLRFTWKCKGIVGDARLPVPRWS